MGIFKDVQKNKQKLYLLDEIRSDLERNTDMTAQELTEQKSKITNAISKVQTNISLLSETIELYSSFYIQDLALILAELLTELKGRTFIVKEGSKKQYVPYWKRTDELYQNVYYLSLTTNTTEEKNTNDDIEYTLISTNSACGLEEIKSIPSSLTFGGLISQPFNSLPKDIKEFIKYAIEYKIENKRDILTIEEMKALKEKYLLMLRADSLQLKYYSKK